MSKSITKRSNRSPQLKDTREIVECDVNRDKAFDLYIERHMPITQIAREMGFGVSTVHGWINHKREKLQSALSEKGGIVLDRSSLTLDKVIKDNIDIIERWKPLAIHDDLSVEGEKYDKKGNRETVSLEAWEAGKAAAEIVAKAQTNLIRAIDAKAKLYGLHLSEAHVKPAEGDPAKALNDLMQSVLPKLANIVRPKAIEAVVIEQ